METASKELKKYVPEQRARRVFAKVFDDRTVMALHRLASRGKFDVLEFVISTGKEAHVFRAVDKQGNYKAVKIYMITTSSFKHMNQYIGGDERFKSVKKDKREIVYAWTKKEFKNLARAAKAGVRVPKPVAFFENVLVMEFIGHGGMAARTVKECGVPSLEEAYGKVVEWLAKLMYSVGLIHADLSEYNMLTNGKELVLIDIGQAVLNSHPKAREFFERDARNVANYFTKMGLERSYEQVLEDVRAWKVKLKGAGKGRAAEKGK